MSGNIHVYTNNPSLPKTDLIAPLLLQESLNIHGDQWYLHILQISMRRNQSEYKLSATVIKKSAGG